MATKETALKVLDVTGMKAFDPVVRLIAGEDPSEQIRQILMYIGVPILAFGVFLAAWSGAAKTVETKYGTLPTPAEVYTQAEVLIAEHFESRDAQAAFYAKQAEKSELYASQAALIQSSLTSLSGAELQTATTQVAKLEQRAERAKTKRYSESPTYWDQILTSLKTVFAGFVIASLIAIPVGILCGLNSVFLAAVNPLIQIFKPVSPLAWLPIVMIVVGAVYTTDPSDAWFEKSFISSAFTVALCSLWPTLVNTALGVASIEKDHMNVAKVLNLGFWTRIRKIVLPSALPLMFAGLRISLGVGWMVLIAAEMLAQNPGLGKFVWDMFQNGSSQTLAQIIVAVFTIGFVGFLLDRVMVVFQKSVSYGPVAA